MYLFPLKVFEPVSLQFNPKFIEKGAINLFVISCEITFTYDLSLGLLY